MGKTSIQWTEFSVNPLLARNLETGKVGHYCEKIAAGCKFCYSGALQPRFGLFPFLAENRSKVELFLDEGVLRDVLRRRKPTTYFWCSMTDMFLADYPDEWIDRCFATMALTPQHRHIVLTKRGRRMREYMDQPIEAGRRIAIQMAGPRSTGGAIWTHSASWPLPNVILGVSAATQADVDEQIPELLRTPAACRLLSLEPQIEDVDLSHYLQPYWTPQKGADPPPWLGWVIQGGESGPRARPFDLAWARKIRDQCAAADTKYFLKQVGAFPCEEKEVGTAKGGCHVPLKLSDSKGGDPSDWPIDLRDCRAYPEVIHAAG